MKIANVRPRRPIPVFPITSLATARAIPAYTRRPSDPHSHNSTITPLATAPPPCHRNATPRALHAQLPPTPSRPDRAQPIVPPRRPSSPTRNQRKAPQ
jgi:hypothetical protein